MIRLYLDWNIINGMRTSKESDVLFLLKKYLGENRSYFEIYYSHAHLSDLAGHKKVLDSDARADLDYLSLLTDNCAFHIANGNVQYGECAPLEWYQSIIEDNTLLEANSLDDLLKGIAEDIPELSDITLKQIELFKRIPISVEIEKLKFIFPDLSGNSLYDVSNAILKMNKDWMNTDAYGKVRTFLQNILSLDSNKISSAQDPFAVIDNNLKVLEQDSSYSKMEQVINDTSGNSFQSYPAWFNSIISTYLNLDMLGYSSDQIKVTAKRKHTFHNTLNDAFHAACASMCHIYILADKKARRKVEATFERLGISTIILSPNIGEEEQYNLFVQGKFFINPQTPQELFNSVMEILNSSEMISEDANNGEQKIMAVYPNCFFYGFFNKIIAIVTEEEVQFVLGTKEPTNWQGVTVEAIVRLANQLLSIFGVADNGMKQIVATYFDEVVSNPESNFVLSWGGILFLYIFSDRVQLYFPPIQFTRETNDRQ